jgi:CheY-like chemotaxis protein
LLMSPKLLVADDSVTIQRVIELTFADEDIKVSAVGDGQLAVDRIEADPPDIILADVGMPKRDGYEVAAYVKSRPTLAHIPVVLLTGAFEPVDQARATAVGCDGILAKPFEPQMVIARVKQLLGHNVAEVPPRAVVAPSVSRGAERATVGVEARSEDRKPPSPVTLMPGPELSMDTMRSKVNTSDSNASLDDYFDQLDAAFSKLGSPPEVSATDALVGISSPPQTSSNDFDWVPETARAKTDLDQSVQAPDGLRQTGVGEFEWVVPTSATQPGAESDNFDFLDVAGIAVDAPAPTASQIPRSEPPITRRPDEAKPAREDFQMPEPVSLSSSVAQSAPERPKASAPVGPASLPPIADAFAALLDAEQGEPPARPMAPIARVAPVIPVAPVVPFAPVVPVSPVLPVAPVQSAPASPAVMTDAVIDQIAKRVLDQLSDQVVRDTVTEMVSRIAERLVREEIERIKGGAAKQ